MQPIMTREPGPADSLMTKYLLAITALRSADLDVAQVFALKGLRTKARRVFTL